MGLIIIDGVYMGLIRNGADALTLTEQKIILSAQTFYIETKNDRFFAIILNVDKTKFYWQPDEIDDAIVYCKKNNLVQIHN